MDTSYPPVKRAAWKAVTDDAYDGLWDRFYAKFGWDRSAGITSPVIRDPEPSITFDLSSIPDGPRRVAARASIEAEALRCFLVALPEVETLVVLDWQHPAYEFQPAIEVLDDAPKHDVNGYPTVYPDGDYYAFLTPDFSEGTFGHPWEPSLCVIGSRLVDTLGRSLATWLPIKRAN